MSPLIPWIWWDDDMLLEGRSESYSLRPCLESISGRIYMRHLVNWTLQNAVWRIYRISWPFIGREWDMLGQRTNEITHAHPCHKFFTMDVCRKEFPKRRLWYGKKSIQSICPHHDPICLSRRYGPMRLNIVFDIHKSFVRMQKYMQLLLWIISCIKTAWLGWSYPLVLVFYT